jgi:hypothetical protein
VFPLSRRFSVADKALHALDGGYGMPMRGYPEDTERKLCGYLVKLADQDVSSSNSP